MAYNFIQLYDKDETPTFPMKGPNCYISTDNDNVVYWYKFATITSIHDYTDASIAFQVNRSHNSYAYGILYVHTRTDSAQSLTGVELEWAARSSGIRPLNWAANYNGRTIDLYAKKTSRYEDFHIEVLSGESIGKRNYALNVEMTLHTSKDVVGLTALPTTGTTKYSCSSQYRIGDIITTTDPNNPNVSFGGTWEQIKDVFLLGAGGSYGVNSVGGEKTHILTELELPKHQHTQRVTAATNTGTGIRVDYDDDVANAGAFEQGVLTGNVGDNTAHNNMPPYLAVYIWRRTG